MQKTRLVLSWKAAFTGGERRASRKSSSTTNSRSPWMYSVDLFLGFAVQKSKLVKCRCHHLAVHCPSLRPSRSAPTSQERTPRKLQIWSKFTPSRVELTPHFSSRKVNRRRTVVSHVLRLLFSAAHIRLHCRRCLVLAEVCTLLDALLVVKRYY